MRSYDSKMWVHICQKCFQQGEIVLFAVKKIRLSHKNDFKDVPKDRSPPVPYVRRPSIFCRVCNVFLCIQKDHNCWGDYHSKVEYWSQNNFVVVTKKQREAAGTPYVGFLVGRIIKVFKLQFCFYKHVFQVVWRFHAYCCCNSCSGYNRTGGFDSTRVSSAVV